MKNIKYLFLIILMSFISLSSVSAEVKYNEHYFSLLNRNFVNFPFTTWYTSGEDTTYTGSNYVEFADDTGSIVTPNDLPKYIYAIYCGTAKIDLQTVEHSTNQGSISNYGSVKGGSCEINSNGNYYDGNYYLNRWLVHSWSNYSTRNLFVYGVRWSIRVHNTVSYNVFVRFESMFVSNELITDFSSDVLLNTLISQNSSLRSELNEVKSNTSQTNNKLDETNEQLGQANNKLDETNEQLGEVNNNITSSKGPTNLGALDNSAGWLPSGPIDSILNLPLSLLNSLLTAVSSTCQPLNITFPFVDFSYQLPCISSIYSRISGLNAIIDLIGYTVGVLILYYYFKHLYNWIDNKITMKNDNDWGGI